MNQALTMNERIDHGRWGDEDEEPPVPLTAAQAQALREKHPQVSAWRVVATQALVGVAVAALAWGLFGGDAGLSALYGAAVIVLPTALLARGVGRLAGSGLVAGAMGFLVWTGVKLLLSLAMLLAAARVVPGLNWPALLVAMAVCLQVNWLALLWRRR
jgi:ATP synthase protein I